MTVMLRKETYYFLTVSQLHLRYASCRATENSTHFIISTPLDDCGTVVNETEHGLIFWNEVQAHDIKIPFTCRYSRKTIQSLGFTPQSIFFGHEGNATISLLFNISVLFFFVCFSDCYCFNLLVFCLVNVKLPIFSKSSTFVLQK